MRKKYRHDPYYLTKKDKAKTKTFSVPRNIVSEIGGYIDNYHLLKSRLNLMEEISEKNIKMKIADYRKTQKMVLSFG